MRRMKHKREKEIALRVSGNNMRNFVNEFGSKFDVKYDNGIEFPAI